MFQKAVKQAAKLRMAIAGPSGSGKTYTALSIATHLAGDGRVAVVDTEHGSASKYADIFDFDVAEMHAPYHPDKYVRAISEAAGAGYRVIILDSLSHAWNGAGGLLEIVEQAAKKYKGNTYAGWKDGTPIQNRFIEAIVSADIHIIGTMRSKQEYILVERNGRQAPQKVGMAPVQRDGFEYEFDVFMDMDIENNGIISKTRCPELTGRVFGKPGQDVADILNAWLSDGAESAGSVGSVQPPTGIDEAEQGYSEDDLPNSLDDVGEDSAASLEHQKNEARRHPYWAKAHKRFMAVGSEAYESNWHKVRHENVLPAYNVESSNDMTPKQLNEAADKMQAVLDRKKAKESANGAPGADLPEVIQPNEYHSEVEPT